MSGNDNKMTEKGRNVSGLWYKHTCACFGCGEKKWAQGGKKRYVC